MLTPHPPFIASLNVTVRIDPLITAVDVSATNEILIAGIQAAVNDTVGSGAWKGYSVSIDIADPDNGQKFEADDDLFAEIHRTIGRELARQHSVSGNFMLPALASNLERASGCNIITVQGRLDVGALANTIYALVKHR